MRPNRCFIILNSFGDFLEKGSFNTGSLCLTLKNKKQEKKIDPKIIKAMYTPLLRLFTFYYGIDQDQNVVAFC